MHGHLTVGLSFEFRKGDDPVEHEDASELLGFKDVDPSFSAVR